MAAKSSRYHRAYLNIHSGRHASMTTTNKSGKRVHKVVFSPDEITHLTKAEGGTAILLTGAQVERIRGIRERLRNGGCESKTRGAVKNFTLSMSDTQYKANVEMSGLGFFDTLKRGAEKVYKVLARNPNAVNAVASNMGTYASNRGWGSAANAINKGQNLYNSHVRA